jgi:protein-S-isoprenylcysteine O-methyltransferase Ste14
MRGGMRHPFYLAYTLTWTAGLISAPSLGTLLSTGLMFVVYWRAAKHEEGKFSDSRIAKEYSEYQKRTGMFLPFVRR